MEDNLTTQLSEIEKAEFETLEGTIERQMGAFMAVGAALLIIRDRKLYREQFRNFKAYCAEKWGMSNNYANRLISGSQVAANLVPIGTNFNTLVKPQPTSEYQVRPLTALEPAQQCEVWEEAVRSADGKTVTFKQVKALVDELVGPTAPLSKKKDPHPESDALHFATIARSYLDRIRDDDPLREKALEEVRDWIIAKLKEPPVKKSS